jgi:hypothetical protein
MLSKHFTGRNNRENPESCEVLQYLKIPFGCGLFGHMEYKIGQGLRFKPIKSCQYEASMEY